MPSEKWMVILFCMETKPTLTLDQPAPYRLRLQGRVTAAWHDWLKEPIVSFVGSQTVVTGTVRDQAGLFGLISFVRDLGVPLVAVEFIQEKGEDHGQHYSEEEPAQNHL